MRTSAPVLSVTLLFGLIASALAAGAGTESERLRAKGFVYFAGHWMLPAQRDRYSKSLPALTVISRADEPIGVVVDREPVARVDAETRRVDIPLAPGRHQVQIATARRGSARYNIEIEADCPATITCLPSDRLPNVQPRDLARQPPADGVASGKGYRLQFAGGKPVRGVLERVDLRWGTTIIGPPGRGIEFDPDTWQLRGGYGFGRGMSGTYVFDRALDMGLIFLDPSSDRRRFEAGVKVLGDDLFEREPDAMLRLAQLGARGLGPKVAAMLAAKDPIARRTAAQTLIEVGDEQELVALEAALQREQDRNVAQFMRSAVNRLRARVAAMARYRAYRAAKSADEKRTAMETLLAKPADVPADVLAEITAAKDAPAEIVEKAVLALGSQPGAGTRAALEKAVRSTEPAVRRAAVRALTMINDLDVVPLLKAMLYDPDADVRDLAARGLGAYGVVEPAPALIDVLKDENPKVRAAAAWALRAITGVTDAFPAEGTDEERAAAMAKWAKWWQE